MSSCRRYEEEGLLLEEQGRPLPPHFSACPDCRAARETYGRLREDLRELGEGEGPAAGWEERVRARIRDRPSPPSPGPRAPGAGTTAGGRLLGGKRRFRRWAPPLTLAAALILLALLPRWDLRTPPPIPAPAATPKLEATLVRGPETFRGVAAQPGDTLVLEAAAQSGRFVEIRLYRGERDLLARCGSGLAEGSGSWTGGPSSAAEGSPRCRREPGSLRLEVPLRAPGRYHPVLLDSAVPLPDPAAGLDDDTARAVAAGARLDLGDELVVR